MSSDQPPAPRRATRAVVLGGAASGLAAYAFTILGARALGEVAYAPVGVLWTLQYLVMTVGLLSIEAYVTREQRIPRTAALWVVGLVGALALLGWTTGPTLFGSRSAAWPVATALLGVGFGLLTTTRGLSASRGRFATYGLLTGGESVLRLLLAGVVLWVVPTAEALALTMGAGALGVVALWPLLRRREPVDPQAASLVATPEVSTRRFLVITTSANAAAQVLLAGGPLLTALLGAMPATTSRVFVTTTLARAPLTLIYSGLLTRLLTAVQAMPHEVLRGRVLSVAAAATGLTAAGGVAGWLLGPELVGVAFGDGLRPSPAFAALTGMAVVLATGALAANQVLIARRAASRLVVPWVLAVAVGAAIAAGADLSPDLRAGWATVGGLTTAGVALVPQVLAAVGRPVHQPV